jgi:hypothetical protein
MRIQTGTPVAWARHQRMCSAIWASSNRCSKSAKPSICSSNRFKAPAAWMASSALTCQPVLMPCSAIVGLRGIAVPFLSLMVVWASLVVRELAGNRPSAAGSAM